MSWHKQVLPLRGRGIEQEALRLFFKRLAFIEAMNAGKLTEAEIVAREVQMSLEWIDAARRCEVTSDFEDVLERALLIDHELP